MTPSEIPSLIGWCFIVLATTCALLTAGFYATASILQRTRYAVRLTMAITQIARGQDPLTIRRKTLYEIQQHIDWNAGDTDELDRFLTRLIKETEPR